MDATRFEWDQRKNLENRRKHGVSFEEAQYAFDDPHRVIAEDIAHSRKELRYFCFGRMGASNISCEDKKQYCNQLNFIRLVFSVSPW